MFTGKVTQKRKNRAPPLLTKREPCAYHSHSVLVSTLEQARHNNNKRRERDATSLLCKVQEEGVDQRREAGHVEEQAACSQRFLPVLWDQGLQDRQALASSILPCPAQHTWQRNILGSLSCGRSLSSRDADFAWHQELMGSEALTVRVRDCFAA